MGLAINPIVFANIGASPAVDPTTERFIANKPEWKSSVKSTWKEWKRKFLTEIGDKAFVKDPSQENQIVSESMAYGLLFAVQMRDQKTFDALLRGLREMEGQGLPVWRGYIDGRGKFIVKRDSDSVSASDSEQDIAMALIQADTLVKKGIWSKPRDPQTGKKDKGYYGRKAQAYLNVIWDKEVKRVREDYLVKPSEDWGDIPGGVVFNPSYVMPAWYDYFAAFDNNPNHKWADLKDSSYDVLEAVFDKYGRIPDWCQVIQPNGKIEVYDLPGWSNEFGYDAIRVMWRVAQDALFSFDPKKRERAVKLCRKFIDSTAGTPADQLKVHYYDPRTKKSGSTHNNAVLSMYVLAAYASVIVLPDEKYDDVKEYISRAKEISDEFKNSYRPLQGISAQYYNESLCFVAAMILGDSFDDVASTVHVQKESPEIKKIKRSHKSWPYYYLEYLPVIGPAVSPSDNSSMLWLDGTRRAELDMLIYNIEWLDGKKPAKMRTIKVRMEFCGNLVAWGYMDEAITQYQLVIKNLKYNDNRLDNDERVERRKVLREAIDGLVNALYKSGKTEEGIKIFREMISKDPDNLIAHAALAELLSIMPQEKYEPLAIAECRETIKLLSKLKVNDPEVAVDVLLTLASILARKGRGAPQNGDFEGSVRYFKAVEEICNLTLLGQISSKHLNELVVGLDLELNGPEEAYLNRMLRHYLDNELRNQIRLTQADLLFSIISEMYVSAEIKLDIEANKEEPEILSLSEVDRKIDVPEFLMANYDGIIRLYESVLKNVDVPTRMQRIFTSQKELNKIEDKNTEFIYKSVLGLMRVNSNRGRLKNKLGQDGGKDFEVALAISDIALDGFSDYESAVSWTRVLGEGMVGLLTEGMKRARKYQKSLSITGKFVKAKEVEIRIERMQIWNDQKHESYEATIHEYERLLREEVSIGRVRPHFERIIYYIDNWEYDDAIMDCNVLIEAYPSLRNLSTIKHELLSEKAEEEIKIAQELLIRILEDENYIQRGDLDREKHEEIVAQLGKLTKLEGISSRNKAIFAGAFEMGRGEEGEDGRTVALFGDAYDLLTNCLEINHMFKVALARFEQGDVSIKQLRKEANVMKKLREVRDLLEDMKYAEARKLCNEIIRECENDLDEDAPITDVQRMVLLDAAPKYAEALAKSGRPFEAIAVYKSMLGMEYNYVEFVDSRRKERVVISDGVKKALMVMADKELKGYSDVLFRTSPYIKNNILAKLAELYVWKETQDQYIKIFEAEVGKKRAEDRGKREVFDISKKYFKEVFESDPSNRGVVKWLNDLSEWLSWLKGGKNTAEGRAERKDWDYYFKLLYGE